MGLTRQRSRADGHYWYRSIIISSVVSSCLALLLQFVGFVTPGWIVLSQPSGFTVSAGVWYIQVCNGSPKCRTASMTSVVNPFNVAGDKSGKYTFCTICNRPCYNLMIQRNTNIDWSNSNQCRPCLRVWLNVSIPTTNHIPCHTRL